MSKVVPLHTMTPANNENEIKYQVHFNNSNLEVVNEAQVKYNYPSNAIKTSKYTAYDFVPKNLFNQFKRFYNMYFLFGAILAAALPKEYVPIAWYTMVFPLLFVVGVTLLKDGYEDYKRHMSDKTANEIEYHVIRAGKVEKIASENVKVGDIMLVKKGEKFPSDLVLLSSSAEDGTCFIETCELDGETNLKRRQAIDGIAANIKSVEDLDKLSGCIQGDPPNEQLNAFTGRLILNSTAASSTKLDEVYALSLAQCLLRGSRLRNTDFIYGVVFYAGKDTKIFRNSKSSNLKFSSMEGRINFLVLMVLILNASIVILSALMAGAWQSSIGSKFTFLRSSDSFISTFGKSLPTFFISYTYMIPLSLFVTIEVVRVVQGLFMEWDDDLTGEGEISMVAKNTNLNEELGNVEYIFSDKTGTLTQNEMKVTHWFLTDSGIFDERKILGALQAELSEPEISNARRAEVEFFLKAISVCHTVLPAMEENASKSPYEAPSPDELALLMGLKANGLILSERTKSNMKITYPNGSIKQYTILQVLEFNSDRKRMSIIVKSEDGKIELFCKGADSFVFRLLSKSNPAKALTDFQNAVDEFANQGLRTLAVAWRPIKQSEFDSFNKAFKEAESALEDREEKVNKACEIIEQELMLLGATAIEDRLQDQVPETLEYLVETGVKIWLLTGDKQETAINIGMSSKLISPKATVLKLNVSSEDEANSYIQGQINEIEKIPASERRFSLVIDGFSLTFILPKYSQDMLKLAQFCNTVICCRVTPLQKALVVRLVKTSMKKICLSIGDGANDVSMIQEAHIGVGIMGKEGSQAARSADYAFAQFRFLKRLMVLHGRYSNLRISKLVLYSFYKNIALIMVFLWYSNFFGWSSQAIYNDIFLTFFNVFFTSFGPLFLAIFEKDISETTIMNNPKAFSKIKDGLYYRPGLIAEYIFFGLFHSVCVWLFSYLFNLNYGLYVSFGREPGIYGFQFFMSSLTYLVVYYKFFLMNQFWAPVIPVFHVVSSIILIINMVWGWGDLDSGEYQIFTQVQASAIYWLGLLFIPLVALLPDFTLSYIKRTFYPTDGDILQEQEQYLDQQEQATQFPSPALTSQKP